MTFSNTIEQTAELNDEQLLNENNAEDKKSWSILGHTYWPVMGNDFDTSFSWITYDPPGTFVPPHRHGSQDEHVYILEGEYSLYVDGEWTIARKGDSVKWPKGSLHGYRIDSDKPGRALMWVSPAGDLSTLFDELHNLTDPEEVVRVSAKRDIFFAKEGSAPGYK
ncbi:cupin domain-containing protein [Oceanisphaera sp.]|uniref:cupin domain-containing protein n=1 Tax=Oceanisphaera sp. TaxID=1929979 RepID=UPI003A8E7AAA